MTTASARRLGKLIRAKRTERRLNQIALAAAAGVTQPSISEWERGEKTPSLQSLLKLRDALGIAPDEFSVWIDLAGTSTSREHIA